MQLIHSSEVEAAPPDGKLLKLLQTINEADLKEWVERISVPRHFVFQPQENRRTADWIADLFRAWNYRVRFQGEFKTIVAEPTDLTAGGVVLVGAHYDSVSGSPGADDNGSAVAAMLGCAAACALWKPTPAVVFVAFNREEEGMIGSRDFVEKFLPGASYKIKCAHILEMVGFASSVPDSQKVPTALPIKLRDAGDFLGLLADSASRQEMDFALERAHSYANGTPAIGLHVQPGVERVFPVLARSDHAPFWEANIPAMLWTDTAEFRNPNYHLESDLPETLNYTFLRSVCQLLTACAIDSAKAQ
jgi:hypothetical protein